MPRKGFKHSPESIAKMRAAHIGGKGWPKGVPRSPETIAKMSAAAKQQPMPEGFKAHQFKAGEPGLRKGKKHTPESIEKMRASHNKNSSWTKGKALPQEMREKISKSLIGNSCKRGIRLYDASKARISAIRKEQTENGIMCGPNHPNWNGGSSFGQYCEKFNNEFKERVRAFFGYHCVICGQVWHPGDEKLHVHHCTYLKSACCDDSPKYFVPLCRACHNLTSAPNKREYWRDVFTKLIEQNYGGKSYFTKEEMMGVPAPPQ